MDRCLCLSASVPFVCCPSQLTPLSWLCRSTTAARRPSRRPWFARSAAPRLVHHHSLSSLLVLQSSADHCGGFFAVQWWWCRFCRRPSTRDLNMCSTPSKPPPLTPVSATANERPSVEEAHLPLRVLSLSPLCSQQRRVGFDHSGPQLRAPRRARRIAQPE